MATRPKQTKKPLFGKRKKSSPPKTAQDSIPIRTMFKNGVIETSEGVYARTYKLDDINFRIAPDQEQLTLFTKFGQMLNSFNAETPFTLTVFNHPADKMVMAEAMRIEYAHDGFNKYRNEMNAVLLNSIKDGKNSLTQDKYLTIQIKDQDPVHAMRTFVNKDQDVKKACRRINKDADATPVELDEMIRLLHTIYVQDGSAVLENTVNRRGEPVFNADLVYKNGETFLDVIAPDGMEFRPNMFKLGSTCGCTMFLERIPNWLTTEFMADMEDIGYSSIISVHYLPIERSNGIKKVSNNLTAINAQIARTQQRATQDGFGIGMLPPALEQAQKKTQELMDDVMGRDQNLFYVTFLITLFTEDEDSLKEAVNKVRTISNGHLSPVRRLIGQQEDGFNACLPLGINNLKVNRLMTTESASIFIPFNSIEMFQKGGLYYGKNQITKNLIVYNRKNGLNCNGLIFGESGSGKTMTAKLEMVSAFLRDSQDEIYIIDPDGDYVNLVKALGGEVVDLAPNSKTYINPLDMDIDYGSSEGGKASDPLPLKSSYILGLIEIMHGENEVLGSKARSIADRCIKRIYQGYLQHIEAMNENRPDDKKVTCDKDSMPTLTDLYDELMAQPDREAKDIAEVIELYATGTQTAFAHRTNIDTKARLVDYNVKNLGVGMKNIGLYVCLNEIWNKMLQNRKRDIWTRAYIDEFYLLLQSDSAATFLMNMWKRCRKFNGIPTGIMQNTEDLIRSKDSRNIINNTSFIIMLSLPEIDRMNLSTLLRIPDSQLEYITSSDQGMGLLYNGKVTLPFDNRFAEDTELYRLMSSSGTKDKERRRLYE